MRKFEPDNMILSISELKSLETINSSYYKVKKLVDRDKLIKLNKSFYLNTDYIGDNNDFFFVRAFFPNGIVCMLSAAYYYELTPHMPLFLNVAVKRHDNPKLPIWPQTHLYYWADSYYNIIFDKNEKKIDCYNKIEQIIKKEEKRQKNKKALKQISQLTNNTEHKTCDYFYIYNIEKTIVDIIRYRDEIDSKELDIIMKKYFNSLTCNYDLLIFYAQKMHCEKIVQQYKEKYSNI